MKTSLITNMLWGNGGIADYYSLFAATDPEKKHEGICAFFIDRRWPGVRVGRHIPKMGQRGSNTVGVHFENVRIPKEYALDYAKKRQAFGQKIGYNQSIQFKLADMYQKIETSRLLVWKAAWESDKGIDPTLKASISKFYATEACIEVVDEALQILGGYGYTKMFSLENLCGIVRSLPMAADRNICHFELNKNRLI